MTAPDDWRRGMTPRIVDELEYIVDAFEKHPEPVPIGVARKGQGVDYMYAQGQLLVLERYLFGVLLSLYDHRIQFSPVPFSDKSDPAREDTEAAAGTEPAQATESSPDTDTAPDSGKAGGGDPPRTAPGQDDPELYGFPRILPGLVLVYIRGADVPDALGFVDDDLGEGCASPNHVLTVSSNGYNPDETAGPCAATDPEVVVEGIEPYPGICHCNSGAGVRIYVADTGLIPDSDDNPGPEVKLHGWPQHPWLAGVRGKKDPQTPEPPEWRLKPYAGHGTFVAGVLRCIAPAADIYVGNVFCRAGSTLETDFVLDLQEALHRGTDIFHLSAASPTRYSRPLLSFWLWLKQLQHYQGIVCVAPAGNSGSRRPHWPAAAPEVVSVGALAADWRSRASFTNYGGWVDAYAPGRNLVNAYGNGRFKPAMFPYSPRRPGRTPAQEEEEEKKYGSLQLGQDRYFYGMAQWSGTSFSSPIVTGLIADRMWRTGEDGIEAAAAVLRMSRCHAIPGVGAIALPCGEDRGCRCRDDRGCGCGEDRGCRCGGAPHRPQPR